MMTGRTMTATMITAGVGADEPIARGGLAGPPLLPDNAPSCFTVAVMNRRALLLSIPALWLLATGVLADVERAILRRLRADGYRQISVSRTLLGRVRIVAVKPGLRREIILNPNTGEVLRDLITTLDGTELPGTLADDKGQGGKDDQGGEEEDDDDGKDDRSGRDSGKDSGKDDSKDNSGKGGHG